LYSLPDEVPADSLPGKVAVAVDILRAGTTIATALDAGASGVTPCIKVSDARAIRQSDPTVLLGGERAGLIVDGFDLANSPSDYQPEKVQGRIVVFTSTNGTKAIQACRNAETIIVGSFSNLSAVARFVAASGRSLGVVCAGTDGQPTMEDMLFGGALLRHLQKHHCDAQPGKVRLNLAANAAARMWAIAERQIDSGKSLGQLLTGTQGGKNLVNLGLSADIEFASVIDRFDAVPRFDPLSGQIRSDVDLVR